MDIYDLIEPAQLTEIARLNLADEDRPANQFLLGQWFPSLLVDDIDFEYSTGTDRTYTNAMPFRTWTTEAPIGSRPGRATKRGEMPPLSLKMPLTELDRIRQRTARGRGGNAAEAVEGDVFGDISRGIKAMENRMEIIRADSLVYGTASLAENGVQIDVDFGRDAGRSSTVATAWSDATNGTPIDDEDTVVETMLDEEGLGADDLVTIMNRVTLRLLKSSLQYRKAWGSFRELDRIPMSAVNEVRADHGLPPVIEYNASTNGVDGTKRKLIPDNYVCYLPRAQRIGDTQYGVTAMAGEDGIDLEVNQQPGPIAYMMKQIDPLIVWTVVDGIGFPVLKDPDATYSLDVAP